MTARSQAPKRGPGNPPGPQAPAPTRVTRRQEKLRAAADKRRAEAEKVHLQDDQRRRDAHTRFQQERQGVLDDLERRAGRSIAEIAATDHLLNPLAAIEDRLRDVSGADLGEPISVTMDAADAKALRDELKNLSAFLGAWLHNFAALLPAEPRAQFLDRVAPGQLGPLSRARKLQRDLDLAERRAAALADYVNADVPKAKDLTIVALVLPLAQVWKMVTGEYPHQAKRQYEGTDTGEFAEWAIRTLEKLAPEAYAKIQSQKAPIADALRWLASPKAGGLLLLVP